MPGPVAVVVSGALLLSGIGLCGVALVAWRGRDAPIADRFAVVALVAGIGTLAVAASIAVPGASTVAAAAAVGLVLPVPWLLFAFEYTGRDELRSFEAVALVATPPAVGLASTALIFASRLFPWLSLPSRETASGAVAVAVFTLAVAQSVALLYAGGLMLVGTGLLLWTFHRYRHLDSTSGALLGVFGSVPWLSLLFGFQVDGVSRFALPAVVAVGFLIGAVAAGSLLRGRRLFRTLPAAGTIGPATVFEELADIVVVTDSGGTVVELNATAERALDARESDVVGGEVAELLGRSPGTMADADVLELQSDGGRRLFEPTVSVLTDQRGLCLGYAVVLRDVTDRTIRQQRLEVFNRVLRHNIRNQTSVLVGEGELLIERLEEPALLDRAESVIDTARGLAELSETAREIERLLADADAEPREVSLAALAEEVLESVSGRADRENAVPDDLTVETSRELLRAALSALVENAVEHGDAETSRVTVCASHHPDADYPVTLSVVDDGPGIPEIERETILEGEETQLRHGSGLGLWLVRWAVTCLGGELDFAENDPHGTVVSIRLPGTIDE